MVVANMEQHLNGNMRVEIEELEFLFGPENSEVELRQILRYARRKQGGRIFEHFSSKGQSERLAASRVRWDERQRLMVTQEEESRREAQDVDHDVEEWCSEKLPSCRSSLQWMNGVGDNRSGLVVEEDKNTGEVGERDFVLVFRVRCGAK